MFCSNCGSANDDRARFCEACGKPVVPQASAPAGSYVQPAIQQPYPSQAPVNDPRMRGYAPAPIPASARNPGLALVLSFFIPGVGQLYNGQIGKGIATLIAYGISWVATGIIIGFFGLIGIWIWSMRDAYKTAKASTPRY